MEQSSEQLAMRLSLKGDHANSITLSVCPLTVGGDVGILPV